MTISEARLGRTFEGEPMLVLTDDTGMVNAEPIEIEAAAQLLASLYDRTDIRERAAAIGGNKVKHTRAVTDSPQA